MDNIGKQLTTELKGLIEGYLSEKKGRSRQTLAKDSGIAYNTITRIVQTETVPNFESAFSILKVVAEREQLLQFVEKYYPEVFDCIQSNQENMDFDELKGLDLAHTELDEIFSDTLGFEIICLAWRPEGVTKKFIESEYGRFGVKKIEQLSAANLLMVETNGNITTPKRIIADYRVLSKGIRRSLDIMDGTRRTSPNNIGWYSSSLNQDGVAELNKLWKEFDAEVKKVNFDKKYAGEITVMMGSMMGFLNDEQYRNKDVRSNESTR